MKGTRPVLPGQKCCHGYSLTLLEEFDKTDPLIWNQFKQDTILRLTVKTESEANTADHQAEPASWMIIDDKRGLERDRLDFFLKLSDRQETLLAYTFTVIFGVGDETQLFQNCILECVNWHEYVSSVYPDYQRRLRFFPILQ